MSQERTICCCGASSWTKVFAWLQIVGNALMLVLAGLALAGLVALNLDNTTDEFKEAAKLATVAAAVSLVLFILGFVMGIILLIGTSKKRVSYLKAWLIYAVVDFLLSLISVIINVVGTYGGTGLGSSISGIVFSLLINGFTFWVVLTHIKEIRDGVFGNV